MSTRAATFFLLLLVAMAVTPYTAQAAGPCAKYESKEKYEAVLGGSADSVKPIAEARLGTGTHYVVYTYTTSGVQGWRQVSMHPAGNTTTVCELGAGWALRLFAVEDGHHNGDVLTEQLNEAVDTTASLRDFLAAKAMLPFAQGVALMPGSGFRHVTVLWSLTDRTFIVLASGLGGAPANGTAPPFEVTLEGTDFQPN